MTYKYEHDFKMCAHCLSISVFFFFFFSICLAVSVPFFFFVFFSQTNCFATSESEATSVRRMEILLGWMQQQKKKKKFCSRTSFYFMKEQKRWNEIDNEKWLYEAKSTWKWDEFNGAKYCWGDMRGENPTSLHHLLMASATDSNKRISKHTHTHTRTTNTFQNKHLYLGVQQ